MAAGVGDAVLADARLLVTELVVNAVRHGAGDTVRLVVDAPGAGRLRCEVTDDGFGFLPVPAERARGWGLRLVASLAAAWGVRGGATSVWFELRG